VTERQFLPIKDCLNLLECLCEMRYHARDQADQPYDHERNRGCSHRSWNGCLAKTPRHNSRLCNPRPGSCARREVVVSVWATSPFRGPASRGGRLAAVSIFSYAIPICAVAMEGCGTLRDVKSALRRQVAVLMLRLRAARSYNDEESPVAESTSRKGIKGIE
jgi:hypothetical protein